ncbi:Sec20-domain-containing protein [Chytriomyces sp. MP71]|nr:Sec20-domain-containing protein [Chytriomyces sp. MP71]
MDALCSAVAAASAEGEAVLRGDGNGAAATRTLDRLTRVVENGFDQWEASRCRAEAATSTLALSRKHTHRSSAWSWMRREMATRVAAKGLAVCTPGCLKLLVRKAKLDVKAKLQRQEQDARDELLRGNSADSREKRRNMQLRFDVFVSVEAAKQAGSELTESMRQATQMMAAEVEKSAAAVQALQSQTIELEKTRAQYSAYEAVLAIGSNLLKEIHRGSIMDKLIIYGGLGFFLLTVFYILWKRTWIPGLSLLFRRQQKFVEDKASRVLTSTLKGTGFSTSTASSVVSVFAKPVIYGHAHDEL